MSQTVIRMTLATEDKSLVDVTLGTTRVRRRPHSRRAAPRLTFASPCTLIQNPIDVHECFCKPVDWTRHCVPIETIVVVTMCGRDENSCFVEIT